jgi:hypothetical protein
VYYLLKIAGSKTRFADWLSSVASWLQLGSPHTGLDNKPFIVIISVAKPEPNYCTLLLLKPVTHEYASLLKSKLSLYNSKERNQFGVIVPFRSRSRIKNDAAPQHCLLQVD